MKRITIGIIVVLTIAAVVEASLLFAGRAELDRLRSTRTEFCTFYKLAVTMTREQLETRPWTDGYPKAQLEFLVSTPFMTMCGVDGSKTLEKLQQAGSCNLLDKSNACLVDAAREFERAANARN